MPEIKVQCDCGQRYKFEVEPVDNRMPYAVTCPVCGMDGTGKADEVLQQLASAPRPAASAPIVLAAQPVAPASAPPPVRIAVPAPAAAPPAVPIARLTMAPQGAVPPAPPAAPPMTPVDSTGGDRPRLRISKPAHEEAPAPAADQSAPPAAPPVSRPRMVAARPATALLDDPQPNILLGVIGAVIGGAIGMFLWYWLVKVTQLKIGYAAWGVGVITGVGARVLARAASPILGAVAGLCALVAIAGGLFWVSGDFVDLKLGMDVNKLMNSVAEAAGGAAYDEMKKHGDEAVKAETDDQIKVLYSKVNFGRSPDAEELSEFKTNELVRLRDIGSGKLSRKEFIKNLKAEAAGAMGEAMSSVRWDNFKANMDTIMVIFMLLGVTTAFKVANG